MKKISANKAAVVVVDVQAGLFCTEKPPYEASAVVERINAITAKARAAKVPVFFVHHDGPPDKGWLVPFTAPWRLHPDLKAETGDITVRKTTGDAFYGTPLEHELRARGVDTVVLAGYATDFCIDCTLRNAASKEFAIVLVGDAHTTDDSPVLKAAQIRDHANYAWANCTTSKPITVLPADQVEFGPAE
jgi:nicotinamidase-related amidase